VIVQERSDKPVSMSHRSVKTKVLLVEDNIPDARLIREMLHEAGSDRYVLETAGRLSDAITLTRKAPFDIVLLDLGLPDSQGMETLSTYLESASEIPVIVLTGLADDAISVQAVESGAQDYLVKGRIDGSKLIRAIRYAIGRAAQEANRREADEALKISEKRFRDIADHAQEWIWEVDAEGRYTYSSQMIESFLGYTPEEILQKHFYDGFHPEDREALKTGAFAAFAVKQSFRDFINRNVHKDGHTVWLSTSGLPLLDEMGNLLGYRGVDTDITKRRQSEEELRTSEERYRTLFEKMDEGFCVVEMLYDSDGKPVDYRFVEINPAFEKHTGLQEAKGKTIRQMVPNHDVHWFEIYGEVARTGQAVRFENPASAMHRYYDVFAFPVGEDGSRKVGILFNDITERKRGEAEKEKLQAQLQQAMKMEAVGRLAGGIAHDFNNLLTVIIGSVELALMKLASSDPAKGLLAEVNKAAERATLLTQQLLAFSRKQIIEPKVLILNDLIADLNTMMVRLIREDINIQILPGKDLGAVKIDPGQFQQVLVNLVVNARDAMPGGGKIVIETANVDLDDGYCALHPYVTAGRFVMLSVSDTGHGMSDEVKAHIFEPFYTTKAKGKGTGLGLATTHGVVKQSGGSIEVYSEVGIGTTFKIYLPRVEDKASKLVRDDKSTERVGGTETVLVVEDEEILRSLCVRILDSFGYRVFQAGTGDEAIALATGYGERIDLLLTDVVMPGMSGAELAMQLVLHHPEAKVLFTSGYTENAITRHGVLDEGVNFINKPYAPSALAKKVREVLDKA
jgi:two-component system cell cycle sensor histidine kinase/response regulator CckA